MAGGLGVFGAVSAYLDAKKPTIAVLKALGADGALVRNTDLAYHEAVRTRYPVRVTYREGRAVTDFATAAAQAFPPAEPERGEQSPKKPKKPDMPRHRRATVGHDDRPGHRRG